jgi:acyl carrier protein
MNEEIERRLISLIAEYMDLDPKVVMAASNLSLDLGMDSMDRVVLMQAIEEEFEIEIGDDDADRIRTVEELCELVEAKVRQAK